jgi:hypothetical protein
MGGVILLEHSVKKSLEAVLARWYLTLCDAFLQFGCVLMLKIFSIIKVYVQSAT